MSNEAARLIVITGTSRGLGRALAVRLAELGHVVCGCARNPAVLGQPRFQEVAVDVSDDRQVERWAHAVLEQQGPPDLLVNNAAVINTNAPLWQISAPEFQRVLDINIAGTANVIRHFVPAMIERGAGLIVNFSSGWGRSVDAEVAPYCASKWAIEGLTKALALELPKNLAAVALNPGIIDTDMLRSSFGAGAANYMAPAAWSVAAADFLLQLGPRHNGKSLTVPGQ